jgi:hypothetical protein
VNQSPWIPTINFDTGDPVPVVAQDARYGDVLRVAHADTPGDRMAGQPDPADHMGTGTCFFTLVAQPDAAAGPERTEPEARSR